MMSISHIPSSYGNLVPWQPECSLNNSFIISLTEFIFGMEVPSDYRHQPTTLLLSLLGCHGNQINYSFVLGPIDFIFGTELHWPHSMLL